MALSDFPATAWTVGHVPLDSFARVDRRVKDVTRREVALHHARRAAERFERAAPWGGGLTL